MIDGPKQSSRKDLSLKCEGDFGEEERIKQIEVTVSSESGENWEEACLVTSSRLHLSSPF